jgi:hypothetical protein
MAHEGARFREGEERREENRRSVLLRGRASFVPFVVAPYVDGTRTR